MCKYIEWGVPVFIATDGDKEWIENRIREIEEETKLRLENKYINKNRRYDYEDEDDSI